MPVLLCVAASSSTSRLLSVNMRTHTPPEYLLTFSLRNACVVPYDDRASRFRTSIVSLDAEIEAIVHGFSEYVNGYQRLTGVRPPAEDDAAMLKQCDRRPLGIGVPFSCNNIYHQAFHAVPAFERWAATVSAAPTGDLDFVPLIYPTAAVGKKMSVEPSKWHAWEFSIRPFTRLPSAAIANRTHQIVNTACTCYDTLHGNAEAFNPIALRSAARLRAFRQATLANLLPSEYPLPEAHEWIMPTTASAPTANSDGAGMAGAWAVPRQLLLWAVRRHKLRNIENEEALATHLASDPLLSRCDARHARCERCASLARSDGAHPSYTDIGLAECLPYVRATQARPPPRARGAAARPADAPAPPLLRAARRTRASDGLGDVPALWLAAHRRGRDLPAWSGQ